MYSTVKRRPRPMSNKRVNHCDKLQTTSVIVLLLVGLLVLAYGVGHFVGLRNHGNLLFQVSEVQTRRLRQLDAVCNALQNHRTSHNATASVTRSSMITGHGDSGTSMNPIRIAVPNITSSELTKQLVVTAIYVNKRRRILYCVAPGLQVTKTSFSWQEALSDVMLSSVFQLRDNVKLSSFTTNEQREILSTYFKFLFVQHPFERLVSTYKKKFGGVDVSSSEKLNPLLAAHIRLINQRYKVNRNNSHFINDSGAADYSANRSVTFQQMVRYVLDKRYLIPRPFGRLLYPYSDLCLPCVIRYDYIGHYETFDADIDYLRHSRLGIQTKVRQTDTVDRNLPVEVVAAFRSLSEADVKRLSNEYQLDFELFGYENKMLT